MFYSDPYVRIDVTLLNEDITVNSVCTKTKKKVRTLVLFF